MGMITLRLTAMLAVACIGLGACGKPKRPDVPDIKRLSTDVHVMLADHQLVLPFIALDDYAHRSPSFSLDPKGDRERAATRANDVLRDAADPDHPLTMTELSVTVQTYGWDDFDTRQRQMCPLLTRAWARSVCDNPWAAIQQALPSDRFRLMDLRGLDMNDQWKTVDCLEKRDWSQALPQNSGETAFVCEALVFGAKKPFYWVAVRIDGDLGAFWIVSSQERQGESAEMRVRREGEAIAAFVHDALGANENFADLHAAMCRLRRPGSDDAPSGPDCQKSD